MSASKRTELVQLRVTPETLEQWTERANALGMSVALWAGRTLDKASIGPMPSLGDARASDAWLERYLAWLNHTEAERHREDWPESVCRHCGYQLGAQNPGDTCDTCKHS